MNFAFQTVPEPSQRIIVKEGIDWFRMPLPFALDHVNCWLLGQPGQQTLIDTGVNNDDTRKHWQAAFKGKSSVPDNLLVTHFHPDHIGLAAWFGQYGVTQFSGSRIEIELACELWDIEDADYEQRYGEWYALHGLPGEVVDQAKKSGNTYRRKASRPPPVPHWQMLSDGQSLQIGDHSYTVMVGRGHAPDMIMLYRAEDHVLIAADQVLPSISPNVSVMPRISDNNPLASFLASLEALKSLPEDTLVLPSHGVPFYGLHARLHVLMEHHELRLAQVLDACTEPRCAYELFEILFRRKLDAQQTAFALGESLAHLHFLQHQNKLTTSVERGVQRFQRM